MGRQRSGAGLRWGVLGVGAVAHRFASDLKRIKGARLVCVAALSRARAEQAAGALGAERAVAGADALFGDAEVDIVYIASPSRDHHHHCIAALAHGKHVLCEKPLAMNAAEAREIAAAAGSAGRFCMEAMWTQFLPAVAVLERWIGEGRIGAPGLLQASFGVPTPSARPANGGALHDRGCYGVSLALRLLGPVRTIDARWRAGPDGRDLSASLLLVFDHGARAMIGCSLLDRLDNRLTVGGERGLMSLNDIACPTAILYQAAAEAQVHAGTDAQRPLREQFRRALRNAPALIQLRSILSARTQPQPCRGYGLVHEIEHVMVCLDEQRLDSPLHPLSRSIATLKVIDSVLGRSADDGGARR